MQYGKVPCIQYNTMYTYKTIPCIQYNTMYTIQYHSIPSLQDKIAYNAMQYYAIPCTKSAVASRTLGPVHETNFLVSALIQMFMLNCSVLVYCKTSLHMGQFLQDGKNIHYLSLFLKKKSRRLVWPNQAILMIFFALWSIIMTCECL